MVGKGRNAINFLMVGFTILILITKFTSAFFQLANRNQMWMDGNFTTWCINWQAGYVRRGLQGEILYQLFKCTHVEPQYIFVPICTISFLLLGGVLIFLLRKHHYCWWSIPLTICWGALPVLRTDSVYLLLVVGLIFGYVHIKKIWLRFLFVNLIGAIALNIHEMAFLLSMPLLTLLSLNDKSIKLQRWLRPLFFMPTICAFLLVVIFSGKGAVDGIIESWRILPLSEWWKDVHFSGVVSSLGLKPEILIKSIVENIFYEKSLYIPNFVWFSFYIYVIFFLTVELPFFSGGEGRSSLLKVSAVQFAILGSLFILISDFGRLSAWCMISSYLFWAIIPHSELDQAIPRAFGWVASHVEIIRPRRRYLIVIMMLVIGLPGTLFSLGGALEKSVVGLSALAIGKLWQQLSVLVF